jgi:hypothetical protein
MSRGKEADHQLLLRQDVRMGESVTAQFEQLVTRWDLRGLQEELTRVLREVDEAEGPYVPSELCRALDMFLDSYGQ